MAKWIHCSNKGRPPAHRDHCGINAAHEANLRSTLWTSEGQAKKNNFLKSIEYYSISLYFLG